MINRLRRIAWGAGLVAVLILTVSCGSEDPSGPLPTPTLSAQRIQLESEIAAWEELGLDSYTARVTYRKAGWDPQVMDMRVVDGEASFDNFECFPERTCFERTLQPQDFTLDKIFDNLRPYADEHALSEIVYNSEYGFPRIVNAGGQEGWEISNFQPMQ